MARGRLRIYLGAAPGVGKTVAMLGEGHRRAERGTDVVVALCETYGRPHTAALLDGLEDVPRRRLEYRGTVLEEMDVDAVLARRPRVALVDELAHTNVPGCRNEKRWQDVDELLDAGIDVISTVNIQHLESLNDVVTSITGILQRETVPDEVVRAADQIDLVDMSPEALRRRMAHGNIYTPEKVDAALANYFRVGNLSALRELSLLWLADRVDASLEDYRAAHGITQTWPTRERVVVALTGGRGSETLLRRGARIASRLAGGELVAAYVSRSDGLATAPLSELAAMRRVTEEIGGEFHTVTGDDTAEAILDFARGANATQVLVGTSMLPAWRRPLRLSMAERIIAESGDIDVHVVTVAGTGRGFRRRRRGLPRTRVVGGTVAAVLAPLLLTGLLGLDPITRDLPLVISVYLLGTVAVAAAGGLLPAVLAAVVSTLLMNWFFIPPVGTLTVSDPRNTLALGVFVVVGVTVALIVHRSAARAEEAQAAQRESAALVQLSHTLLGSTDQLPLLLRWALDMFGVHAAAILRRPATGRAEEVVAATPGFDASAPYDRQAVDEDHCLALQPPILHAEQRRLLDAFAAHAGAAVRGLPRPPDAAGGHQGGDRQPALDRRRLDGRGGRRADVRDRGLRRPAERARRQPARPVPAADRQPHRPPGARGPR